MNIEEISAKRILTELYGLRDSEFYQGEYEEPHRHFHTWDHIENIFSLIDKHDGLKEFEKAILYVVAFFHDIVYYPSQDKLSMEHHSANRFVEYVNLIHDDPLQRFRYLYEFLLMEYSVKNGKRVKKEIIRDHVYTLIEETEIGWRFSGKDSYLTQEFQKMDHNGLLNGSLADIIEAEKRIYKEYQVFPYKDYIKGKNQFFEMLGNYSIYKGKNKKLSEYKSFVENRRLNVGVYAGTFNPFHIGHANILRKASLIFDKVIVALGSNPEKNMETMKLDVAIRVPHHEIIQYDCLTTDLLDQIAKDKYVESVSLIRGLRNGDDFSYEINMLRFMQDMNPNINVVYLISDKKYDHISSSAIRALKQSGYEEYKKYLDKLNIQNANRFNYRLEFK